jgi:hypothetical protein
VVEWIRAVRVIVTFVLDSKLKGENERIAVNEGGGEDPERTGRRTIGGEGRRLPTLESADFEPPEERREGFHDGIETLYDMKGKGSLY